MYHFTSPFFSEFCGAENNDLDVSREEIPKEEIVDYILAPPDASLEEKQAKGMLVYCVDVSGSMGSTVHIPELQSKLQSGSVYTECQLLRWRYCSH